VLIVKRVEERTSVAKLMMKRGSILPPMPMIFKFEPNRTELESLLCR
jgi:hypothetical protein